MLRLLLVILTTSTIRHCFLTRIYSVWFLGILWYKCLFLDEIEKSTCEPSLCLLSNPWGKTIWIEMRTLFAGTCKYLEVTFIWLAFYTWLERWRGPPAGIRLVRTMGVLAMQRHHVLRPHLDMLWRFSVKWKRRNLSLCLSKYLILGGVLWEIENRSLLFFCRVNGRNNESRAVHWRICALIYARYMGFVSIVLKILILVILFSVRDPIRTQIKRHHR